VGEASFLSRQLEADGYRRIRTRQPTSVRLAQPARSWTGPAGSSRPQQRFGVRQRALGSHDERRLLGVRITWIDEPLEWTPEPGELTTRRVAIKGDDLPFGDGHTCRKPGQRVKEAAAPAAPTLTPLEKAQAVMAARRSS
jgi:hypothetical protein